jgi:hypothetical protein
VATEVAGAAAGALAADEVTCAVLGCAAALLGEVGCAGVMLWHALAPRSMRTVAARRTEVATIAIDGGFIPSASSAQNSNQS